mmetsp:Transcript_13880/g.50558  ORF Transcript_13880/g.50558 Transcript_13880/m.50558 type:complete len:157 (+) Transcript_13880:315-785(+)
MSFQDPYYLVHDEIEANLSRVMRQEQSLTNGQGAVSNDAKRTLAEMDEQLDSVDFQLQELNEAMKLAEANPARFRIDHEEIRSRKSYIEGAQSRAKKLRGTVQQVLTRPLLSCVRAKWYVLQIAGVALGDGPLADARGDGARGAGAAAALRAGEGG